MFQGSDLDFANVNRIVQLPVAVAAGQPVTYEQLTAAIEAINWKINVRVSTQNNINLSAPGATIDSITMNSGDRFLVRNQSTQSQNGIYIWNGASVAATRSSDASTAKELENAVTFVAEGSDAGKSWRQSNVNFTLGTGNVIWTQFGVPAPNASTTVAGIIEIADQTEVNAGTATNLAITPATLAGSSYIKKYFFTDIGNGLATNFIITHNLGTRDLMVIVSRNTGDYDQIACDIAYTTTNTVTIGITPAPGINEFRVKILG